MSSPPNSSVLSSLVAAGFNLFRDQTDEPPEEDGTRPRPRLAGLYTQHLKGEDHTAAFSCMKDGEQLSMTAVADGHGGNITAQWLCENILEMIASASTDGSSDALRDACTKSFAKAHDEVKTLTTKDGGHNTSGSTCVVVIFNHARREITCANVGDSEAVLIFAGGHQELTTSHNLSVNKSEVERVRALEVEGVDLGRALDEDGMSYGPLRAWPGGLAVTRGIGDADAGRIVSCEPSCFTMDAPAGGGVLLSGSDGLWDALPFEKAARYFNGKGKSFFSPTSAAKRIVRHVTRNGGLNDDTSAATLFFDAADPTAPDAVSFVAKSFKPARLWKYSGAAGAAAASGWETPTDTATEDDDSKHSGAAFAPVTFVKVPLANQCYHWEEVA